MPLPAEISIYRNDLLWPSHNLEILKAWHLYTASAYTSAQNIAHTGVVVVFLETFPFPSLFLCHGSKDGWRLFPSPPAVVARLAAGVPGTAATTIASRRAVGAVVRTGASLGRRVSIWPAVVVVVMAVVGAASQQWSGYRHTGHCRRDVT